MKIYLITALSVFYLFNSQGLYSQEQRSIQPFKIDEKVTIDGVFDEEVWKHATVATDFIQTQPQPKEISTERTEVQIAYDDQAMYIAAKLFVKEGTPIYKELGQIDDLSVNAESFFVFFDTFNDDQNGFGFGLTAAGVQQDAKYSPDSEDFQWNGVWESDVRVDENGWYAEMRIPFFNLRFSKQDSQDWGINFLRNIRHNREQAFWNHVDQNVNGFVNQWGELQNIESIDTPLRLFFTPFLSTNFSKVSNSPTQSDFNAGLDVKYGINESFTLDMTLIPDFGGVQSDEQILNLSPFEQAFEENRAFFTEGTELFGKNNLFQSRRIGQSPSGSGEVEGDLNQNEIIEFNQVELKVISALAFLMRLLVRLKHLSAIHFLEKFGLFKQKPLLITIFLWLTRHSKMHLMFSSLTQMLIAPETNEMLTLLVLEELLETKLMCTPSNLHSQFLRYLLMMIWA